MEKSLEGRIGKTTIYYFTGTGNSLAVARGIGTHLESSNIVNIAKLLPDHPVSDHSDIVGIVAPVYFENIPDIVRDFVKNMTLNANAYVFGVVTCGSGPGFALNTLDRCLKTKGSRLAAGFSITMPDNVVIFVNLIPPLEMQQTMITVAKAKMLQIADIVRRKEVMGFKMRSSFKDKLEGIFMKTMATKLYRTPRKFGTTEKCSKCGTCMRICPTNNIKIKGSQVSWDKNCIQCLACFHWCPNQAIFLGKRTRNVVRYHHPEINVKDLIIRDGDELNK